ncbi:MAG: molecular chaperone DnaJ [Pirellulales bacterium]
MAGKRDYYEVLGVKRSATDKQIADAYRKLAIKFHPDKNPGDEEAVVLFKEAAEAFEVLGDGERRARYDRFGHAAFEGGGARGFGDVNDIFAAFGDIFGDSAFGDLFGRGRRRQAKGADVRCDVTLDLMQAARGATVAVEFQRHETCADCDGSGARPGSARNKCSYCGGRGQILQTTGIFRVQTTCPSCHGAGSIIKDPCPSCRASGFVLKRVKREVQIPAGIDDQMRLRLPGEGEPSPNGGPRGDCYCFITVREHELFQRDGQHLIVRVPISYSQAALGAKIEVPTLSGPHELELPPGTQSAEVFKLRGKGLPSPRGRGVGDLLVQVNIEVPKALSAEQEALLRQLAEHEHVEVSPHRKSFFDKVRDFFGEH